MTRRSRLGLVSAALAPIAIVVGLIFYKNVIFATICMVLAFIFVIMAGIMLDRTFDHTLDPRLNERSDQVNGR